MPESKKIDVNDPSFAMFEEAVNTVMDRRKEKDEAERKEREKNEPKSPFDLFAFFKSDVSKP